MPSIARKALAASLVALHAAIMLCGPALHAAPGLGHFEASNVPSKPDGPAEVASTSITTAQGEHCPLCDFFAQGQLPIGQATVDSHRLVVPVGPTPLPVSLPRPLILSSQPRAPPQIDSRIVSPTTSGSTPVPV